MKKIKVNESCIGCGACVSIAKDYFDFNDQGYSYAKKETIEDKDTELVMDAAGACPVEAIEVTDVDEMQ